MHYLHITIAADLYGCPNRCRHCWLGHTPNANLPESTLPRIRDAFRPFADSLEIDWWYREPDFPDNYRELWNLTAALSDCKTPHFELASVWRLVRDPSYAGWLAEKGVRTVQLTLFGGEAITDRYTGRRGAYREILQAMDILLSQGITPRIQTFVNKKTLPELPHLDALIREMRLEERCRAAGGQFAYFLHTGSCDGAAEELYPIWITPEDLSAIPDTLAAYTCAHFGAERLEDVFGQTEAAWCAALGNDSSTAALAEERPVFFVDHRLDVYPNFTAPAPWWKLGNLVTDSAESILQKYSQNESTAQRIRKTVPLGEIVRRMGDPDSRRLFGRWDFTDLMLNRYCRMRMKEETK